MAVEFRLASTTDIDGIRRVAAAAWHEAHGPIVGTEAVEEFLDAYYDAGAFRTVVEDEAALLAVAVSDDNVVIGFVSATPEDDTPATYQLSRLYVTPDRWGEGIGRGLLDRAERVVRDRGGRANRAGGHGRERPGVGFYESAGYRRVDTFDDDRIDTSGYTYEKQL